MFLKIWQNSQENTCANVSFLKKLQVSGTGVFLWISWNFWEQLFCRIPPDDCFWLLIFLKYYYCVSPFNDTHRERQVFHSIQYRNGWLAASDLFHMFTQSIKFYTFHYQYKCLENVIHPIDSANGWLLLSASFTSKFGLVFVLTLENAFF